MTPRNDAIALFNAAVAAVQPAQLLPLYLAVDRNAIIINNHRLPFHSFKNLYVVGAGKAAAAMAVATEAILGDYITNGIVITKYGHALRCKKIEVLEGAHPVPDERGVAAVSKTIQLLQQATSDDIIICLISGGASALWCDVPESLTLQAVQATFDRLIKSGAAIHEINTVRKHLSSIKGGQLVRHCNGASVFSLIISDVPGNDLSVIASGPTVGDKSTFKDAYAILSRYELFPHLPQIVQTYIQNGIAGIIKETPMSGDALFQHTTNTIIGSNAIAVEAAAKKAVALGYTVAINDSLMTGDSEAAAQKLVDELMQYQGKKPYCIIQGGETTVKVTGNGKGGRNQHFVLAALNRLSTKWNDSKKNSILLLSGGTDGTDGPTDAAGAIGGTETIPLAVSSDLSIETYLQNHDAYTFFEQTGGLVITGATQTNVMDIMLGIVY